MNMRNVCIFKVGEDFADDKIYYKGTVFLIDQWNPTSFSRICRIRELRVKSGITEKLKVYINNIKEEEKSSLDLIDRYCDFYIRGVSLIEGITNYIKWNKDIMIFECSQLIDNNKIRIMECGNNE